MSVSSVLSTYLTDAIDLSIVAYSNEDVHQPLDQRLMGTGWDLIPATVLMGYNQSLTPIDFNTEGYFQTNLPLLNAATGNAFVAYSPSTNTAALVFRGTDEAIEILTTDIIKGGFSWSNVFDEYKKITDAFNSFVSLNNIQNVLVTGHSLGGVLAEQYLIENFAASPVNYFGITFGSPGAQDFNPSLSDSLVRIGHSGDFVYDLSADPQGSNGTNLLIDRPDLVNETLLSPGASEHPKEIVLRHGYETALCAGYAAILTTVAASASRAFCSALI